MALAHHGRPGFITLHKEAGVNASYRKKLLLLAIVLTTLLLAAMWFTLFTERGLRVVFNQINHQFSGTLSAAQLHGKLIGPLSMEGLRMNDEKGFDLQVRHLDLDWSLPALLKGKLNIKLLRLDDVDLHFPKEKAARKDTGKDTGVAPPLDLVLERLEINGLNVSSDDSEVIQLQHTALSARSDGNRMEIAHLEVDAFDTSVSLHGSLMLTPEAPMQAQVSWKYKSKDGRQLSGSGSIQGNIKRMEVHQKMQPPVYGRLDGEILDLDNKLHWDAHLHLERGDLDVLIQDYHARVSGDIHSSGNTAASSLKGHLELEEPTLGKIQAKLDASLEDDVLNIASLQLENTSGSSIEGRGKWALLSKAFDMKLGWTELRWPANEKSMQLLSKRGQLKAQGEITNFDYMLACDLQSPGMPFVELESSGHGNPKNLEVNIFKANLLDGKIGGSGNLDWSSALAWKLQLEGNAINPAGALPELPGRLDFELTSSGGIVNDSLETTLDLHHLTGVLRDYPVHGKGQARLQENRLDLKGLSLVTGQNTITAAGEAGKHWDVDWRLDARELKELWPGLAGQLVLEGRLHGDAGYPDIRVKIDGSNLALDDRRIGNLAGVANLPMTGDEPIDLDLKASGIHLPEIQWTNMDLIVDGTRTNHRIKLNLDGDKSTFAHLRFAGGLDETNTWTGKIAEMEFSENRIGHWHLTDPSKLILGQQRIATDNTCFLSDKGEWCLNASGNPGKAWSASVRGDSLSLDLLKPWLPEDIQFRGSMNINATLLSEGSGLIGGEARLTLPQGKVQVELGETQQMVDVSGARLHVQLSDKGADSTFQVPMAELGAIEGDMRFPGLRLNALDPQRQPIAGSVTANISDLSLLSWISPYISAVRGAFDANLKLGGTIAIPELEGHARLDKGSIDIPALGVQARDLHAKIDAADTNSVRYDVTARSGDGELQLQGETRLNANRNWPTKLRLTGKSWVAVDIPEATVAISPNLVLTRDKEMMKLDGELRIPFARLRPREIPKTATTGSADLVLIKKGKPVEEPIADTKLHSNIRLILGNRVSFEGFGLRTRLTGNLGIIDEPGRPVIGNGSLNIVDGSYKAYNQDLSIERGRLLFAESPIDNPLVDLRAVRKTDEITAGLNVSGNLKKPVLTLFSSPKKSEGEILSYLLTGRAPSGAGTYGSGAAASVAMAATGTQKITDELARQLRLDELRVDTGQNLQEASVVAGTWLNPRLYMQYINELATGENKLRLRYDLTKKLQIQSESGNAQGIDLFYTIER